MTTRISQLIDLLQRAVLAGPAKSAAELRNTIGQRAAAPLGEGPELPETLQRYVDKVAHAPYKVIDEDIDALREDGLSDDVIFEVTVTAALVAGLERYNRGIAALKGQTR